MKKLSNIPKEIGKMKLWFNRMTTCESTGGIPKGIKFTSFEYIENGRIFHYCNNDFYLWLAEGAVGYHINNLDELEKKEYPRGFVRDYLRSKKLPYAKVDEICKLIPNDL
jgi:hypothetical protein